MAETTPIIPMVSVVIPAAGNAARMEGIRKVFFTLGQTPVLIRAAQAFDLLPFVGEIILVTRAQELDETRALFAGYTWQKKLKFVSGGSTRQQSVQNGLAAADERYAYLAVHDGARPLITPAEIERVCKLAFLSGAAALGIPVKDTVKQVKDGVITATLDRERLIAIQTPQVFEKRRYRDGVTAALREGKDYTDDCQLIEAAGYPVSVVLGSDRNIKVTTPADLAVAEALLKEEQTMEFRIGHGYDVHRLKAGRKLILGGVEIPCEKGLDGHSDADVLAHAVADSILGGLALGDIGTHFPDTDPAYKGADSILLLEKTAAMAADRGYRIGNIDATVLAQAPKLASHIAGMRENLAAACKIETSQVSVKATTEEKLGFTGAGEGIAAHAVCTLIK